MTTTRLHLAPGSGLLTRRPTALLYAAGRDTALVDAFTASPIGGELQALASATVATGFEVGPFVGLSWESGLRVMAFGDIAVETDQPSLPMLSGTGSRTWVEHSVAMAGDAVVEVAGAETHTSTDLVAGTVFAGGFRLELQSTGGSPLSTPPDPMVAVAAAVDPTATDPTAAVPRQRSDAAAGEVVAPPVVAADEAPARSPSPPPDAVDADDPAAALAAIQAAAVGADGEPVRPAGAAVRVPDDVARPPSEPTWAPDPDGVDPDVTLPPPASEALLADVRATEATEGRGSLVDAKRCGNGHANPPTAATCAVCGEFLAPGTRSIVHIPRPSLGRLQLDDGDIVGLEQELLVGRNPDRDSDPSRVGLRRVKTVGEKVSRSHLEVRFQGWDVLVADCGSTNGTFVVPHPGGQVAALEPGRPQMIEPGAVVYFGSRSFTVLGREEA